MFPKLVTRRRKHNFSGCISGNAGGKAIRKDNGANLSTFKESVTLPMQNMYQLKVNRPLLSRFISCSKTSLDEEKNLPRTKEGFDSNAYKLMGKTGYGFNNHVLLGKVVEVQTYDVNKT